MTDEQKAGSLWKTCDVWRRRGDSAMRYRCLQNLRTGMFSVQSADFYRLREADILRQHETQFLELFIEQEPDDRSAGYPTIVKAIEAFDGEFEER